MSGLHSDEISSAVRATSITNANATNSKCRGVWVGTANDYEFSFDGTTWVEFKSCSAGSSLGIQVVGARKTSGAAAPSAGDIVFLY